MIYHPNRYHTPEQVLVNNIGVHAAINREVIHLVLFYVFQQYPRTLIGKTVRMYESTPTNNSFVFKDDLCCVNIF